MQSALSCYLVSLAIFTGFMWIVYIGIGYARFSECMLLAAALGGVLIYRLAPVSTAKRSVTENERQYFKNVVRRNLCIAGIVDILLYLFHFDSFVAAISGAILLAALLLIMP